MLEEIPHAWVNAIAKETYQWAQHIIVYSKAAAKKIQDEKGVLTKHEIEWALKIGKEKRFNYYNNRLEGFDIGERKAITNLLDRKNTTENLTRKKIISSFQKEYTLEESEKLFAKAVSKGILYMNKDGEYIVPIPSIRSWLLSKYANQETKGPQKTESIEKKFNHSIPNYRVNSYI